MEELCSSFSDSSGTQKAGSATNKGKDAARPKSGMNSTSAVAADPAAGRSEEESVEWKIANIKAEGLFRLCSPEQQMLLSRPVKRRGRQRFAAVAAEPAFFFPLDARNHSSTTSADVQRIADDLESATSDSGRSSDGDTAAGVDEKSRFDIAGGADEITVAPSSVPLVSGNFSGAAHAKSPDVQGGTVSVIDGDELNLMPTANVSGAKKTTAKTSARYALGRTPQGIARHNLVIVLVILASFVLGLYIGSEDRRNEMTFRPPTGAMTQSTTPSFELTGQLVIAADNLAVDIGARRSGRLAAASAAAAVGKQTPRLAQPNLGHKMNAPGSAAPADTADAHVRAGEHGRMAPDVDAGSRDARGEGIAHGSMHGATMGAPDTSRSTPAMPHQPRVGWFAKTRVAEARDSCVGAAATQSRERLFNDMLNEPSFVAPDFPGIPPIQSHQASGGPFAGTLDNLTHEYKLFFEEILDHPWV